MSWRCFGQPPLDPARSPAACRETVSETATATRSSESAFLHVALRRAVERSSVRDVAARSGLSHGCVHKIVTGGTTQMYGGTLRKLRTWYLREWADGGDGLTPNVAAYLIEQVLAAIPPGQRRSAAREVVQSLDAIYRAYGAPRPAWLSTMAVETRKSYEPE